MRQQINKATARAAAIAAAAAATSVIALGLIGTVAGSEQDSREAAAARRQLEAVYGRFTDLCRRKDGEGLAALVREVTEPDCAARGVDGWPIRRARDTPLTRELLLSDYREVARDPMVADYAVESARIRIDKLVVLGDTALAITSGEGAGALAGNKAGYLDVERPWSRLSYRDCQTWVGARGRWKLREVFVLSVSTRSWKDEAYASRL